MLFRSADMRYGATVIQSGRVKVNYAGGSGTAQALFTGSNGVPFRVAVNSQLSPSLYLVAQPSGRQQDQIH